MVEFHTTATAQEDTHLNEAGPNTNYNGAGVQTVSAVAGDLRGIVNYFIPQKPTGTSRIVRSTLVLTGHNHVGAAVADALLCYKISPHRLWTEGSATWNQYASGQNWTTPGGDLGDFVGSRQVGTGTIYGSSFAFEISSTEADWGKRGSLAFRVDTEGGLGGGYNFFDTEAGATAAWYPHVVIAAEDDPPTGINDLSAHPDLSLSEATYTFRQRASLSWTASDESDFKRYRIRSLSRPGGGSVPSVSSFTHKAFINSRASSVYLDPALYGDGREIFYVVYPEDTRNGSTSTALGATYCNVSNVISWTKPQHGLLALDDDTPNTMAEVTATIRPTATFTIAACKRVKVVWGDGGWGFTQSLTSAGGYFKREHRYSKATTFSLRSQIESLEGFRSGVRTWATSVVVANQGPVAKIFASPAEQKTAATFSFGSDLDTGTSSSAAGPDLYIIDGAAAPADGMALSFKISISARSGTWTGTAYLLRNEGASWRVKYADGISSSTNNSIFRRSVNWRVSRGDVIGIYLGDSGDKINRSAGSGGTAVYHMIGTLSTAYGTGDLIPRYRSDLILSGRPKISISYALTNPVLFTAKDSYARGSNKWINRFRWAPDYAGDFGAAGGATYTTGATSSFYWAWTSATNAFMGVRAVDTTHASSLDWAGVKIVTEATFRIPDDLRDGVRSYSDNRGRVMRHSPSLGRDYGDLQFGAQEPLTITADGLAHSNSTSVNWLDISRLATAFSARARVYILAPWSSAGSYVQGYLTDAPTSRDTSDMISKKWQIRVGIPYQ